MTTKVWGTDDLGRSVELITLQHNLFEATVSDLGAVLVSLKVPDKGNRQRDVVLGYDTAAQYFNNYETYFGATVGRNANRIENSQVTIDGKTYLLEANEGQNCLHSGPNGYHTRRWEVKEKSASAVTFALFSPRLDQGFPGNLELTVTYKLTDEGLEITYTGLSDADTVFNPTNHSYFNLNGQGSGTITHHRLQLNASSFTPIADEKSIPTGEIRSVKGTPMDFIQPKEIGEAINDPWEQLQLAKGYDHNFAIDGVRGHLNPVARVEGDESGIVMTVLSTLPGVQFYTANFIQDEKGKDGAIYHSREGFCLETQYFPNAMNTSAFESPLLEKDVLSTLKTAYLFKGESHGNV